MPTTTSPPQSDDEQLAPVRASVLLPEKLVEVFTGAARYRASYGGRGSAKSRSFATMLAVAGYQHRKRILCCRELQNSIKDSSMAEVIAAIRFYPWLSDHYEIGEGYIRGRNGTEFLFKGLRSNIQEVKSLSGIDIAWVEEAESVSEKSWRMLIPTIRAPGSEIWLTWNPESPYSATNKRFIENPPPSMLVAKMNWRDNPWFPKELDAERRHDLELNADTYHHIWEGEYLTRSDAQVLNAKWRVMTFVPRVGLWQGPYYGLDFGFAQDPTAGIEMWVFDRRLYVHREAVKRQLELDDTGDYLREKMPGCEDYVMRADCSRPESISLVKRTGIPRLVAAPKWDGSVKDGIAHLRSYKEIIIHPQCPHTAKEARLYQYKVDKNTGDVLPIVVDAHNHTWDAARYGLEPLITRKGANYTALTKL